jgi:hypothetical protein
LVDKLIRECAAGISDREAEAAALAELWLLGIDVPAAFAAAREALASPPLQPTEPKRVLGLLPVWGQKPKPKPEPHKNSSSDTGPQIDAAQNVSEEAKPEADAEEAELKVGLPAVIPLRKPLLDERLSRWDDAMAAMNEQHALIENVGNRTVIAGWEPKPTNLAQNMLVFQAKDSFLLRYSNRFVQVQTPDGRGGFKILYQPLGVWWLGHRERRQHRGITFLPGAEEVVSDCLNMWQRLGC